MLEFLLTDREKNFFWDFTYWIPRIHSYNLGLLPTQSGSKSRHPCETRAQTSDQTDWPSSAWKLAEVTSYYFWYFLCDTMLMKQLPRFALKKKVDLCQTRMTTVRAYNDFLSDPSSVPELSVLLKMQEKVCHYNFDFFLWLTCKPMNFVLPPLDPNVPIRETEPMRLAKEAILKLTFSEMMALGINLSFVYN